MVFEGGKIEIFSFTALFSLCSPTGLFGRGRPHLRPLPEVHIQRQDWRQRVLLRGQAIAARHLRNPGAVLGRRWPEARQERGPLPGPAGGEGQDHRGAQAGRQGEILLAHKAKA